MLRRVMHEQITKRIRRSVQNKELAGEALNARVNDIRRELKNWIPAGGLDSLRYVEFWQSHGVLPCAGGLLDQPGWFLDDLENYLLWYELETLLQRRTTLPPGTPGIDQVTGNNRNAG